MLSAPGRSLNIVIDARPLMDERRSGVGEVTLRLLEALFEIDGKNAYFLFGNAAKGGFRPELFKKRGNIKWIFTRYPNKILNLVLRAGAISLESLLKYHEPRLKDIDLFFLPNGNFFYASSFIPAVLTVHDLSFEIFPEFFSLKEQLWHKAINFRSLVERSNHIIAVSESTKQDLINIFGVPPKKITVVAPSVEKIFSPQAEPADILIKEKWKLPDQFILYLGALAARKNILSLLNVFSRIKNEDKFKDAALVLVGPDGDGAAFIHRAIAAHRFKNDIRFLGYLPRKELPAIYRLARLFVYPSFYEGFGLPALEAMASGLAVAASSAASLPEIVGNAGLLINPHREAELEMAIRTIWSNVALREELRRRGLERAKFFSWEKAARETLGVFKEAARA